MIPGSRTIAMALAAAALLAAPGCGGGESFRHGWAAERNGDVHHAYDHYGLAAQQDPDNGAIADAIRRIAPTTATYWESKARVAKAEKRHTDAWRTAMRCLDIQPHHTGALQLIRDLEETQPAAVASAKRKYHRGGIDALRDAERPQLKVASARKEAPAEKNTTDEKPRLEKRVAPAPKVASAADRKPQGRATRKPAITLPVAPAARTDPLPVAVARKKPSYANDSTAKPTAVEESEEKEESERAFMVVRTISKRDRRFPRQVRAVEGISIRIRDTDPEMDVDLDLYNGNDKRIQKIRDLKIGRSKMFSAESGTWYRITVLHIDHKSHTVRVGIKPA